MSTSKEKRERAQDIQASRTAQENWAAAGSKLARHEIGEAAYFMLMLRAMPDVRVGKVGEARRRIKEDPTYDLTTDDEKLEKVVAAITPDLLA